MNLGIKEGVEVTLKWIDEHFSFRYFCMFFLLSLAFLFGINPILGSLGLPPIGPTYRVIAAVIALLGGAGTILFSLEAGGKRATKWWNHHQMNTAMEHHLHELPMDQLQILRGYAETGHGSITWSPSVGAVCELERRGILYKASDVGGLYTGFAYNITPEASKYLKRPEFQKLLTPKKR